MRHPGLPSRHGSVPAAVWEGEADGLLPSLVAEAGVRRLWLVTDAGVEATGWPGRVAEALRASGCAVQVFAGAVPEPTEEDVEVARGDALRWQPDGVLAIGGGSVLDTAKAAAWRLANPGPMAAWRGWHPEAAPLLPLFAVPTTAGTGSEVQSFALISRDGDHAKLACGTPTAMPRAAVLDARIAASAPPVVTAQAGIDALVHALEAAVTTAATTESAALAERAFALLAEHLPAVLAAPGDLEHRAAMLRAACMAGQAIEASMLGAAHATANPLSARLGLAHGAAVGLMAPHVVRFNASHAPSARVYARLAGRAGCGAEPEALAGWLDGMLQRLGLPRHLGQDLGVLPDDLDGLVADALSQWTGTFNPRPLDAATVRGLYTAAGVS